MGLDSEKIRHEIREYLQIHGRTRSKKLADDVMKKVGSEKTVYREMKLMWESGEIKKTEKNRADIEYELVEFAELMENNFKTLSKQIEEVKTYFLKPEESIVSKSSDFPHMLKLMKFVHTMKQLNGIETRLRLLSGFPPFQKSKSIPILKKQIDDVWSNVLSLINRLNDEKLIHALFLNFPYAQIVELTPVNEIDLLNPNINRKVPT